MMPKNYILKFTGFLLFMAASIIVVAQTPAKHIPTPKYTPPVVKTYLGNNSGVGTKISVEEGKNIIGLPLRVVDAKNESYTITAYQFSYKRVGITENEETGKTSPEKDMVADRFRETPLSPVWVNTIKDELHSGEELYFFDIVAKDKQGHIFFAPELRLAIQ